MKGRKHITRFTIVMALAVLAVGVFAGAALAVDTDTTSETITAGTLSVRTGITVPTGIAERNATGTLTPEQQAQSQKLLAGQIAAIKSRYAQMGLTGSTSELQDIQAAENAQLPWESSLPRREKTVWAGP